MTQNQDGGGAMLLLLADESTSKQHNALMSWSFYNGYKTIKVQRSGLQDKKERY